MTVPANVRILSARTRRATPANCSRSQAALASQWIVEPRRLDPADHAVSQGQAEVSIRCVVEYHELVSG